jgi:predicted DNA-binding transcriptional regulator AlpA
MQPEDDELLDVTGVCAFLGGEEKPLNPSTVYRNVAAGLLPPPIQIGLHISRWRRRELRSVLAWRTAARDGRSRAASWAQWIAELAEQSEEAA